MQKYTCYCFADDFYTPSNDRLDLRQNDDRPVLMACRFRKSRHGDPKICLHEVSAIYAESGIYIAIQVAIGTNSFDFSTPMYGRNQFERRKTRFSLLKPYECLFNSHDMNG